jgi:hypothetical protein
MLRVESRVSRLCYYICQIHPRATSYVNILLQQWDSQLPKTTHSLRKLLYDVLTLLTLPTYVATAGSLSRTRFEYLLCL